MMKTGFSGYLPGILPEIVVYNILKSSIIEVNRQKGE
jgi:hypothetical protein